MKGKRNTFRRWLGLIVLSIFNFQFSICSAQDLLPYPLDTINGEEMYRYEVERSIGLYRISVNFNVPQSEIIRCNPQLQERGLHFGETLHLPTGRPVSKTQQAVKEPAPVIQENKPAPQETKPAPQEEPTPAVVPAEVIETPAPAPNAEVTEIALLLPFESQQTKRTGNADKMLEFYQGALLALQDLQSHDRRFRLRVYDIERSERRVNALCDSTELEHVQGILGVVYPIQIERMAAWSESHNVPLLLPFSDDIDLAKHPTVLQFNASDKQEADSLCRWIIAQDSAVHCVFIDMRETDITEPIRILRKQIKAKGIKYSSLKLHDLINDSAAYALDPDKENLFILHSDKYQHVRILLPHLTQLQTKGYKIRIVSQYSWGTEDITLPRVYTSMFTALADHPAYEAQWNLYFAASHQNENPRFDLLGYDLTKALVAWLDGQKQTKGLQSNICWKQIENGGYQNTEVKVVTK